MATAKRKTSKKGLGEIAITPERVIIWGFGIVTLGSILWFAKTEFDKNQKKLEKLENAQAGINAAGTGINTPTTQTPTKPEVQISQPRPEESPITIPPISTDRRWGTVQNTAIDEFPLRFGQGGLRVSALHMALSRLGLGIQDPTGYFHTKTLGIVKANLGKETVTEAEFINFLKLAKMTGKEDFTKVKFKGFTSQNDLALAGFLPESILGHLGII